jgi:hypothetical protein
MSAQSNEEWTRLHGRQPSRYRLAQAELDERDHINSRMAAGYAIIGFAVIVLAFCGLFIS